MPQPMELDDKLEVAECRVSVLQREAARVWETWQAACQENADLQAAVSSATVSAQTFEEMLSVAQNRNCELQQENDDLRACIHDEQARNDELRRMYGNEKELRAMFGDVYRHAKIIQDHCVAILDITGEQAE